MPPWPEIIRLKTHAICKEHGTKKFEINGSSDHPAYRQLISACENQGSCLHTLWSRSSRPRDLGHKTAYSLCSLRWSLQGWKYSQSHRCVGQTYGNVMKTVVAWHTKIRGSMHLETGVPRSMGEGLAASRRCQVRALHFNTNWQSYHTALRSILKYSCNFGKMSCSPCVVVYVTWTLLTPAQVVPLAIYCLLVWGEGFSLLFPLVLY